MSRFSDLVSTPAREMAAHFPAPSPRKDSGETQPPLIKLDSNENPFGPSPLAIEAMQSALAGAHLYPDDDCAELRRKLADHHSVLIEQVLATAGSTEMLALLCQTLLAHGSVANGTQNCHVVIGTTS